MLYCPISATERMSSEAVRSWHRDFARRGQGRSPAHGWSRREGCDTLPPGKRMILLKKDCLKGKMDPWAC